VSAGGGITDITGQAAASIGRYFNVLSTIPSLLFVSFILLLVNSGAWSGEPNWTSAFETIGAAGFAQITVIALLSLGVSLVLYPVQYLATQILEGYWGPTSFAVRIAATRTRRHRARHQELALVAADRAERLELPPEEPGALSSFDLRSLNVRPEQIDELVAWREAERRLGYFPRSPNDVMPTRLGNALKAAEIQAGYQFQLDAVGVVPYIALVADAEHTTYLDDRRIGLDLAVRVCMLGILASAVATLFLWGRGYHLLVALAPLLVGLAAYHGSLGLAREYGVAMAALIALNRLKLYRALGLGLPQNLDIERAGVAPVVNQLVGEPTMYARADVFDWTGQPTGLVGD
jgi:hypothetical protein